VDIDELRAEATRRYNATMCGGAGCCGDIDSAIDYLIAEIIVARAEIVEDEGVIKVLRRRITEATNHKNDNSEGE
jgi:hypothetical protein